VDVLNAAADEIKRLRKDLQVFEDGYSRKLGELAEGQAREAKLREALNSIVEVTCIEHQDGCATIIAADIPPSAKEALTMPSDDTALKEVILEAKREALLEAADNVFLDHSVGLDNYFGIKAQLRSMAEELK
jgi:hypothetical protein